MVTDMPSSFGRSFMDLSGVDMAREAAQRCYKDTNLTSSDVDVLEVSRNRDLDKRKYLMIISLISH